MFQLLWHQIFINLYNNRRKKLFGSFSSNVVYTAITFLRDSKIVVYNLIILLLDFIWHKI